MSYDSASLYHSCDNFSPKVIMRLHREISQLAKQKIDGFQYVPSESENIAEILADIEGPKDTPFEGGVFRVKLVLGEDYPNSPPRGFFITTIFHPNVGAMGDICVNTLKKDWNQDVTITHIFQVIRCLLIVPFPESSLNDEAGKLFMESYDEYVRRAKLMTSVHAKKHTTYSPRKIQKLDISECEGKMGHNGNTKNDENVRNDRNIMKSSKAKSAKKKALKRL
mmetsp:Transcript_9604/g.13417  ORF Transcript_9604/g.13417 Transcript_9604/m.13417 type:complete len:223 (+) Transcript_9604:11-679(+)